MGLRRNRNLVEIYVVEANESTRRRIMWFDLQSFLAGFLACFILVCVLMGILMWRLR